MRVKKHPAFRFRSGKPMRAQGRVVNRGKAPKLTAAFENGILTCSGIGFSLVIRLDEIQGRVIAKENVACKVLDDDMELEGRISSNEIRLDAVDQEENSWFWLTIAV